MNIDEFKYVCEKLGMNKYFNIQDDDFFWESLSSNSQTMYFTFNKYDYAVAKYVNKKAYVWYNNNGFGGFYKVIDPQTPANLKEQIILFHKNYKEYLIQNKINEINKDF